MDKNKLGYFIIGIVFILFLGFMLYYIPTIELNNIKIKSKNLLEGYKERNVEEIDNYTNNFLETTNNFSITLFKENINGQDNMLISPTSVYYALALTANGAANQTLDEFQILLGNDLTIDDLNKNYKKLSEDLLDTKESTKLTIANSIWSAEDLNIKEEFLQTDKNYYDAEVFSADFTSTDTRKDINNWVSNKTNKLIKTITEEVPTNTRMLLLNALYFDAKWEYPFDKELNKTDKFTLTDGSTVDTEYMNIQESYKYYKNENIESILLPYDDAKNSLLVIMPNNMEEYLKTLDGTSVEETISKMENKTVSLSIPKFETEYKALLNDQLKTMGLNTAFSNADFSNMSDESLYIDKVVHKTYLKIDELGTEAGAITAVVMLENAMEESIENMDVKRPFIYAIINNKTNLPLFIGIMNNPTN